MTRYQPLYVQDGSYAASQDRRLIAAIWPTARSTGCAVTVASGMTLNVAAGSTAVPSQNNTGSTLCVSDATEQVVIAAAPAGGTNRIDLVIVRPRDYDLDGSSNSDFIYDTVAGTAAASPTVPATPAGTVALYQVYVGGGVASLVNTNLTDIRPGALPAANRLGMRYTANAVTSPSTAGTTQQVPLGPKVYDQANAGAANVYNCPVGGRYLVRGSVSATINAGQYLICQLRRNATVDTIVSNYNGSAAGAATMAQATTVIMCNAGDTLDLAWQVSQASVPLRAAANESFLVVDYLGPT